MPEMKNVKIIKSAELFSIIGELFQNKQSARITVTGNSMWPFLREGLDSVVLTYTSFLDIRFGQIVLIKRRTGEFVLHRVVYKQKKHFYISGDAQLWIEGPLLPEQLVAVVSQVWRKDKPMSPDTVFMKVLYIFWWLRLPIRYLIRKPKAVIKKIIPGILKG